MSFEEYLQSKKIDGAAFLNNEPVLFQEWENDFRLQHVESFTSQRKFSINKIRRKYIKKSNINS